MEIVKVKDGYGRNYLIPQKKAVLATESAKKMLAEDLKQRAHKLERIKNEAQELADKVKDITLTVGAKTSSTGKIFGAVGPIQIADAFEKAGFTVDRKVIVLKEPVKEIGFYKATLKLHKEVTVEVAFDVVAE